MRTLCHTAVMNQTSLCLENNVHMHWLDVALCQLHNVPVLRFFLYSAEPEKLSHTIAHNHPSAFFLSDHHNFWPWFSCIHTLLPQSLPFRPPTSVQQHSHHMHTTHDSTWPWTSFFPQWFKDVKLAKKKKIGMSIVPSAIAAITASSLTACIVCKVCPHRINTLVLCVSLCQTMYVLMF